MESDKNKDYDPFEDPEIVEAALEIWEEMHKQELRERRKKLLKVRKEVLVDIILELEEAVDELNSQSRKLYTMSKRAIRKRI